VGIAHTFGLSKLIFNSKKHFYIKKLKYNGNLLKKHKNLNLKELNLGLSFQGLVLGTHKLNRHNGL
jgi:hypothetical protein